MANIEYIIKQNYLAASGKLKEKRVIADALSASLDLQIIMNPKTDVFMKPLDLINFLNNTR
jgi:hypothetical protein